MFLLDYFSIWRIWVGNDEYLSRWCGELVSHKHRNSKPIDHRLKRWLSRRYTVPPQVFRSVECGHIYETPEGRTTNEN